MELIAEMARIRARDVLQCMPLFIACIRGALNAVWSLSARMKDAGQKLAWEGCAAKLCALYEMLPRSLSAGSLRRYVPYMLSDYIDAALRQGPPPHVHWVANLTRLQPQPLQEVVFPHRTLQRTRKRYNRIRRADEIKSSRQRP